MDASEALRLASRALARIAPEADLAGVGQDEDLREALDLDSMDFSNFVIALSQGAQFEIPEADTPRLRTVRGIVSYLGGAGRVA